MYAHHHKGRRTVNKEDEEDAFRDILLLMELLMHLLSKDMIDLAPIDHKNPEEDDGVKV